MPLDYKTLFEQSRRKIRDKLAKDGVRLKNPEENEEKGNKEEKLAEEINLPESDFTDRLKERAQRREDYLRNGTG